MNAPVLVLNDSLKRESETKVHHAGEMLHVAEAFIEKRVTIPTVVCRAYNKALEDAVAVLDKIAISMSMTDLAIDVTTTVDVDLGQGKHANGENAWTGIDGNTGAIADMKESKIWDASNVKAQTFKTAIEAAYMLLRIDDIVSGIKNKQAPGAGPSKPTIETEGDADKEQILPD